MDVLAGGSWGFCVIYPNYIELLIHLYRCTQLGEQYLQISECLTTAYKNGNFPQVPRLVEFLSKITKSIIAVGADIQSRALSACFAVEKIEHVVDTLNGDHEPIG